MQDPALEQHKPWNKPDLVCVHPCLHLPDGKPKGFRKNPEGKLKFWFAQTLRAIGFCWESCLKNPVGSAE